jgi:hypothetical protein
MNPLIELHNVAIKIVDEYDPGAIGRDHLESMIEVELIRAYYAGMDEGIKETIESFGLRGQNLYVCA